MNVSNTLSIQDNMSPALQNLLGNIDVVIVAMEQMDQLSRSIGSVSVDGFTSIVNTANNLATSIGGATGAANILESSLNTIGNGSILNVHIREFENLETAVNDTENILRNLDNEMKALGSTRVNENQFRSMSNVVQYLNSEIDNLQNELIETEKYKVEGSTFDGIKTTISNVNHQLDIMQQNILSTGNYKLSGGEFQSMIENIMRANGQLVTMQGNLEIIDSKNDSITDSTKKWSCSLMDVYAKVQLIQMAFMSMNRFMGFADEYRAANARLALTNDGIQTNAELQKMIYESANNTRADYRATTNTVSRIALSGSTAFDDTKGIVDFTEIVNKALKVGGAGTQESQATLLQLSQALGSGKLQGDEYRSLMENAPYMMDMLAKGLEIPKGALKQLSTDGELTADAIVEALTKMSVTIDEQFEKIPRTFGENMVITKNVLGQWVSGMYEAGGVLDNINLKMTDFVDWLDSDSGTAFLDNVEVGLNIVANMIFMVIDGAVLFGNAIFDNWVWIEPIVWGLVGALTAMLIIYSINEAMKIGSKAMKLYEEGTLLATISQKLFNNAMLTSPTTWIIIGIVAAIALVIYAFTHWQEQTAMVIGAVTGAFAWAGAFIYNIFIMPVINHLIMLAEFIANIFTNPIETVEWLFYDMALSVLEDTRNLASGITQLLNLIPGVEVNLTSNIDGLINDIQQKKQILEKETDWVTYDRLEALDYGESFSKGYNVGYNFSMGVSSNLNGVFDKIKGVLDRPESNDETYNPDLFNAADYLDNNDVNVKVKDKVNLSEESIKYLLEGATQKYINNVNLSSPAPTLTVQITSGKGKIDYEEEAEKTFKYFGTKLAEMRESSTDVAYS